MPCHSGSCSKSCPQMPISFKRLARPGGKQQVDAQSKRSAISALSAYGRRGSAKFARTAGNLGRKSKCRSSIEHAATKQRRRKADMVPPATHSSRLLKPPDFHNNWRRGARPRSRQAR
eukprot:7106414-Alexandrium_andersonii.AAC.1